MILTGPQALAVGAVALLGWTYRTSVRHALHVLRWGPNLLFGDDEFDELIREQREVLDQLANSTRLDGDATC